MPELRPYQLEDVIFLSQFEGAGCFNEQRTGKTPIACGIIKRKGVKKVIIICPASAVYPWQEEFEIWVERPCLIADGTHKHREKILQQWTDGLIVSYDTFKESTRTKGLIQQTLAANPEMIIIDEAHRIRHTKSAVSRAIFACISIPNRLALTGTPAPHKPQDIWPILAFLHSILYPSYWKWVKEFLKTRPVQHGGKWTIDIGKFLPGKAKELQKELANYCTQRKRKEVMPWLPEKDYRPIKLPPTKDQIRYLEELEAYFETEHVITQGILDRIIRYRQICLHPGLLNLKGNSPKLDWIKLYLADYPEENVLIFSKFTSFLKLLEKELTDIPHGAIIGDTSLKQRKEYVDAFQKKKLRVLLIQIDAGKEALTLDQADAAIFTDIYPPSGDIQQAEDRLVATSEDKKDKPHKIIKLMMKGTYDEQLHQLIKMQKTETDIINDFRNFCKKK